MTDLSTLTRDERVAWIRAEYEKSGEPRPFDAEVFTSEMRRKHRPSEQEESYPSPLPPAVDQVGIAVNQGAGGLCRGEVIVTYLAHRGHLCRCAGQKTF